MSTKDDDKLLRAAKLVCAGGNKESLITLQNGALVCETGALTHMRPAPIDVACTVNAHQFLSALEETRGDTRRVSIANDRLVVASKGRRFRVPALAPRPLPPAPAAAGVGVDGAALVEALARTKGFIHSDDSSGWFAGAVFQDASVFCTNRINLIEFWHGCALPCGFTLPKPAIAALLAADDAPHLLSGGTGSVTFTYPDGAWLCSALLPPADRNLSGFIGLRTQSNASAAPPLPEDFFDTLVSLKGFTEENTGAVWFKDDTVLTHYDFNLAQGAATVEGLVAEGCFNLAEMLRWQGLATGCQFTAEQAVFYGDRVRGILMARK